MSVKDVSRLRKNGELDAALDMARREIAVERDEWTEMSLFWVLRDYCKNVYLPQGDRTRAMACLSEMGDLVKTMMDDNGAGLTAYTYLVKQMMPNSDRIKQLSELSKSDAVSAYNQAIELAGHAGESLEALLHEDFGWIVYRYMKAQAASMTSVQVRTLLRDYMLLKNERPSLLHSMILNFALNFAKENDDFKFDKFFLMWGPENLRYDDFNSSYADGHDIPSFISRICRVLVEKNADVNIDELSEKFGYHISKEGLVDLFRQPIFWRLMDLHRNNQLDSLWTAFDNYVTQYSQYGSSHWHSEILKIAARFMTEQESNRFIPFVMKWDVDNLRSQDWKGEKGEDGTEYKPLAVTVAKKCFDSIKSVPNKEAVTNQIVWLKNFYDILLEHEQNDEWSIRNSATISVWQNDFSTALSIYKRLIVDLSDKYYVWSEMAACVQNDDDLKIGLLLKAKNLEKNEDFIGDIHLDLAETWINMGNINQASKEIEAYVAHRNKKGWSIPERYNELSERLKGISQSYTGLSVPELIDKAEDFVFNECDIYEFVLTEKWKASEVEFCNFTNGNDLTLQVKTKRFAALKKGNPGDVFKFRCKIEEVVKPDPSAPVWQHKTITEKTVIPLTANKTNLEPWSILSVEHGVIEYINTEKKTIHILFRGLRVAFLYYKETELKNGDFVSFKYYETKRKDGTKLYKATNATRITKEEACEYFLHGIVAVDDVNETKKLFHVVFGPRKISDIVRYEETDIRPSVGDLLEVTYLVKYGKDNKKRVRFFEIKKAIDDTKADNLRKTIQGRLSVKYKDYTMEFDEDGKPDFGFIGDHYVHRKLLRENGITNDCDVIAEAVFSTSHDRQEWKIFKITKV